MLRSPISRSDGVGNRSYTGVLLYLSLDKTFHHDWTYLFVFS